MATTMHCGQPRIQSVSRFPRIAAEAKVTRDTEDRSGAAGIGQRPLLALPSGQAAGVWEQAYPGSADQLARMRGDLRPFLGGCPLGDEAVLIMSELAANAVRHSRSGEDCQTFTARLVDVPGEYVLGEIEDGGSDSWDGDLRQSARDASGLFIVDAMSAACGVCGGRQRRVVWFILRYPKAAPRASGQAEAST